MESYFKIRGKNITIILLNFIQNYSVNFYFTLYATSSSNEIWYQQIAMYGWMQNTKVGWINLLTFLGGDCHATSNINRQFIVLYLKVLKRYFLFANRKKK